MSTEIREWINEIWEYCQENWAVVAAGAAVAFILLVSFFLIVTARRDDDAALEEPVNQEPVDQEPEAVSNVEAEEEPAPEASCREAAEEIAEETSEEIAEEPMEAPAEELAAEPAEEVSGEAAESLPADCAQDMVEQLIKSVEAVSGASGQKVESIELKIEKARLTIRYAGVPGEETIVEAEPEAEEPVETAAGKTKPEDADFAGVLQGREERPAAEESVMPKKFGAENMNRTRSGRVYTEEELLNQIRD